MSVYGHYSAMLGLISIIISKFKPPTEPAIILGQKAIDDRTHGSNGIGAFASMMLDSTDVAFRCKFSFAGDLSHWKTDG